MSTFYEGSIDVDATGPYSGETCPVCMKGDPLMDITEEGITRKYKRRSK
jgi:hypothetical protein